MTDALTYKTALIFGAGSGLSASLARALTGAGVKVGLVSRNPGKLAGLAHELGAKTYAADASSQDAVASVFAAADRDIGEPDVVVYNASRRARGPVADLDPAAVRSALDVTAFGGFLVVQQAARRMLKHRHGAILLTGATASIKGFALSSAFAMGKFALRGLAQSAARELAPQGIHVAHVVIDGGIRSAARVDPVDRPDSTLDPDAIAETYMALLRQPRNAWSWEIEVRPWVETF
jgi:NAD(P)-dependent dehydrogenase (short-subunit alcohol dehydrogenase family)